METRIQEIYTSPQKSSPPSTQNESKDTSVDVEPACRIESVIKVPSFHILKVVDFLINRLLERIRKRKMMNPKIILVKTKDMIQTMTQQTSLNYHSQKQTMR